MNNTLILGFGNPLLSDDGIGTRIVNDLKTKMDNNLFEFSSAYICGIDIITIIKGYKNMIVVDGCMTQNSTPGELSFYTVDNYYGMAHLDNYHDVKFRDIIKLSRDLNLHIPENIHIVAIEIKEDMVFSKDLSPSLQNSYPEILQKVLDFINQLS
ncbi:MAG: hydrogenase maturation protease [Bacteroidetes bacterium]|nr:hydrogenase maturation protease [Bacteroidota bacterium]MBL6944298.1 hydrogenase maturation protease [Bacteroidales bacterium]